MQRCPGPRPQRSRPAHMYGQILDGRGCPPAEASPSGIQRELSWGAKPCASRRCLGNPSGFREARNGGGPAGGRRGARGTPWEKLASAATFGQALLDPFTCWSVPARSRRWTEVPLSTRLWLAGRTSLHRSIARFGVRLRCRSIASWCVLWHLFHVKHHPCRQGGENTALHEHSHSQPAARVSAATTSTLARGHVEVIAKEVGPTPMPRVPS
jgi:hypothetical protein